MMDRVLSRLLWLLVMGLIVGCGGGATSLLYGGILQLCGGQVTPGLIQLSGAALPSAACYLLCRYGNDLMDR